MAKLKLDSYGIWVHDHSKRRSMVAKRATEAIFENLSITERRAVVRRAYFLIRHEPDRHNITLQFARCLGGKIDLTPDILERANRIIVLHHGSVLQ